MNLSSRNYQLMISLVLLQRLNLFGGYSWINKYDKNWYESFGDVKIHKQNQFLVCIENESLG